MLNALVRDSRYALRVLGRSRLHTLLVTLTIAIVLGTNVSVFAAVNGLLLRDLPVRDASRLVIPVAMQGTDPFGLSAIDLEEWSARRLRTVTQFGIALVRGYNITGDGDPERVPAASVTAEFFPVLGADPALGRAFSSAECRGIVPASVAVIGHRLWRQRYGGDSAVLGRALRLDGQDYTIIGVMPRGFDFPLRSQVWTPYSLDQVPAEARANRQHTVVVRPHDTVTVAAAERELLDLARALEVDRPTTHAGWGVRLLGFRQAILDDLDGHLGIGLWSLVAAVVLMLLIACANLGSLMVGRSAARASELAVRVALGARRTELIRQLLAEAGLLILGGCAAGVAFALWVAPTIPSWTPARSSALAEHLFSAELDARVLGYTVAVVAMTSLLVGLLPALGASRGSAGAVWSSEGRDTSAGAGRRVMRLLVQVQVALTLVLLVTAVLMLQSFARLTRLPLGFRPAGVMVMELNLPTTRYPDHERRVAFVDALLERVRALPGVGSAAVTTDVPVSHFSFDARYECEGRAPRTEAEVLLTADRLVSRGYLETIGVMLRRGRLVDATDVAASRPVVVVTAALARSCWPSEDPVGRRVRRVSRVFPDAPWMTVVGVVDDVREDRAAFRRTRAAWYVPFAQLDSRRHVHLVVRADGRPDALAAAVRQEVQSLDRDQPISGPERLDAAVVELVLPERFAALVMGVFAAVGFLLSMLGVFGVTNEAVRQRTREIGIRLAVGAGPNDIRRLVLGQVLRLALIGAAAGLAGAFAAARVVARFAFQTPPAPVGVIAAAAGALVATALLAGYLPARRALAADPLQALRRE